MVGHKEDKAYILMMLKNINAKLDCILGSLDTAPTTSREASASPPKETTPSPITQPEAQVAGATAAVPRHRRCYCCSFIRQGQRCIFKRRRHDIFQGQSTTAVALLGESDLAALLGESDLAALLPAATASQLAAVAATQMSAAAGEGATAAQLSAVVAGAQSSKAGGAAVAAQAAAVTLAQPLMFSAAMTEPMEPYVGLYGQQQDCSKAGQYSGPQQQMGFRFVPQQRATFQSPGASARNSATCKSLPLSLMRSRSRNISSK